MSDKTLDEKINLKQLEVNIRESLAKEHNWAQQERHWEANQKHWRVIGWLGFAGIMANFAILMLKHWPK